MVLLGGLEILAGAYLINEHKKHKKEKARIQEEEQQATSHSSRPRPSRRRSDSPPRRKYRHEDRKHRSKSPTRYDSPSKSSKPSKSRPSPSPRPATAGLSIPTAATVPASYYHPAPSHLKPQHSPMPPYQQPHSAPPTYFAPPPMAHSPQQRPQLSPSPVSPMEPEYHSKAPFDVPDGFSPEQRQAQALYANNYAPVQYPDHLAELGDPSVMDDHDGQFQYDDGLIYDERRNRHVRFALPRDGDETQLDVVHPRNVPPPPYTP
jgi:hypothetical protein